MPGLWRLFAFKKIFYIFLLIGAGFLAFADRYSHLELFAQTLNLIKIHYFQPVKIQTLVHGAVKGLLREADPYSHFLLPEEAEKLKEAGQGRMYGLGAEVDKKEGFLTVVAVMKNSPAQKAGLRPGDKILKIDDKAVKKINVSEFRLWIKKSRRKKYKLTVLRSNPHRQLVFFIRPASLKTQSVESHKMGEGLFYIRVYYFAEKTLFEISRFLKNKKIKGLLLDLRGNPGGQLKPSVQVADLFLNKGLIVRYKIKTEPSPQEISATSSSSLPDFPLVVLIDEYSASASEIVAGALKDHKRATLVGRKTFGKGSIQHLFSLRGGYALKLTVGEYQTPSGALIHNKGIEPHIKIKKQKSRSNIKTPARAPLLKDPEIYQAFRLLRQSQT